MITDKLNKLEQALSDLEKEVQKVKAGRSRTQNTIYSMREELNWIKRWGDVTDPKDGKKANKRTGTRSRKASS